MRNLGLSLVGARSCFKYSVMLRVNGASKHNVLGPASGIERLSATAWDQHKAYISTRHATLRATQLTRWFPLTAILLFLR